MANHVTTQEVKRNVIKLPHELAIHPNIDNAQVTINEDIITLKLPPAKPAESVFDVWQYVHAKRVWVQVTFIK